MRNNAIRTLIASLLVLLVGCSKNTTAIQSTFDTPITSSPTEETLNEPGVTYFTMDDFASIVIGESTYEDVSEITGSYSSLYAMIVCEYPMQNGKCIRIEYSGSDLIVSNLKIADPISEHTADPHYKIGFENHTQYISFLKNATNARPLSSIYTSKEIKAYIEDLRSEKIPVMLPYYNGKPVTPFTSEKETDIQFPMRVFAGYDFLAFTCFCTHIDESRIIIAIYPLSEENAEAAKETSLSKFVTTLRSANPALDYHADYERVFEDTAMIAGESRSMFVQQITDGHEWIYFLLDGCLIQIEAPTGTVTKDWLKDFSIVAQ